MKTKYLATMFSMLLLMGAVLPLMHEAKALVLPTVYVDPASTDLTGQPIGATFTVKVMINSGDYHVWSGQIGIGWNTAVLNCTGFVKGADVGAGWLWMPGTIKNDLGYVTYSGWSCVAGDEPGWPAVTPAVGEFIKYTFKTVGYGDSVLNLTSNGALSPYKFYKTKLNEKTDSSIVEIAPLTLVDGSVTFPTPPPYGPNAVLTVAPSSGFEPLNVHLDGSGSTGGFNGTHMIPIDWYYFDYGDLSPVENSTTTAFDHIYAAGTWTAILIVHAPVGGGVTEEDTDTKVVKVFAVTGGANIDLFTQSYRNYKTVPYDHWTPYNGTGPFMPTDAFAPQDLVHLYAKVTYGGDAVAHKLVAFEVRYPNGTLVLIRTAMTNGSGIAEIDFRIPAPCEGPEHIFGTWFVYADVDVAEVKVFDNMTFLVGWIVDTQLGWSKVDDVWVFDWTLTDTYLNVSPDPVFKGDMLTVKDKAYTIAYVDVEATFVVTLYDIEHYPIGCTTFVQVLPGRTYADGDINVIDLPDTSMMIPMWAYVGVPAHCFMNAYTAIPSLCGLPYCPEEEVTFEIKKAL